MAGNLNDADTEWGRAIDKPEAPILCNQHARSDDDGVDAPTLNDKVDVAICGGGLAGLAVAIGLITKQPDLNVKVYERAPELRNKSQGILAIQSNGMNALRRIHENIPAKIHELGCERHTRTTTDIDADGNLKDTVTNTKADAIAKQLNASVGITWHNCQQVLSYLIPNKDDTVVTSHSLSHFEEMEDSVIVHFENGNSIQAKILLACDGIFSAARRQLYPKDSPIHFGQLNWGTVIESSKLPPNLHEKNGVHYFQHHGAPRWISMLNDGGAGYTFWQFRVTGDPKRAMELSGNGGRGGLGLPGVKQRLVNIASETCPTVAGAIEAIPEEQIFERCIVARCGVPSWLSPGGRVALVGDSAHGMHPNIAQGANSAFESAAAIVEALSYHGTTVEALKAFETTRKPRADIIQRFANALGVLQATGKDVFSRDHMVKMLDWIRSGRQMEEENGPSLPNDFMETLMKFDPLEEEGVSPLWR